MKPIYYARILIECFNSGNKVLIIGNGGSASQSNHFASELVGKYQYKRKALPAISLTSNNSILTSISNDFSFKKVFSRQVEALGRERDVLILLSTSGKSRNVLEAKKQAIKQGLIVIDFPRIGSNVGRIQEYQLKLMHDICSIIETNYLKPTKHTIKDNNGLKSSHRGKFNVLNMFTNKASRQKKRRKYAILVK